MRRVEFFTVQVLVVMFIGTAFYKRAEAQLDPSSALILNSGSASTSQSTGSRDGAVDSGRYTIRPRPETRPETRIESTIRRDETRPVAGKRIAPSVNTKSEEGENPPEPVTVLVGDGQPLPREAGKGDESPRIYLVPSASSQPQRSPQAPTARELSRQLNMMDLSFSPGFLYTNSDSTFFYRRYSTASPTLNVDANVWLSPTFGLHGSYFGSLSGHVNDSLNGSRNVPASHQRFSAGLRLRRFFGGDNMAPVAVFGIDYSEYEFRVPSDSVLRSKLKTIGAVISVEADVPATATRSWTLGATLSPKLQHKESATSADFKSGGNVDANAVGVSLGGRLQFERRDAIFWKLSHTVEKDLFSGDAGLNDPNTGITPSGVSVINSFTLFEIGYTWGN